MLKKVKQVVSLVIKGNLPALWDLLVRLHREEPEVFLNPFLLRRRVAMDWKQLDVPGKCPNCGKRMLGYKYSFDYHGVQLLLALEKDVKMRMRSGLSFTEANKINTSHIDADYTAKSKKTQLSKLGLIAKLLVNGEHVPSGWVITNRGFSALRGESVPKHAYVINGKLMKMEDGSSDPPEMITIGEILSNHNIKFSPYEWYEATGPVQMSIL